MKIKQVLAREIFDSKGCPTVECQLVLSDGNSVIASVPAGTSKGLHEAYELRDADRLGGFGVLHAVENIRTSIAPLLLDQIPDVFHLDQKMIEFDGTTNKQKLGANAMLAASMAIARAQAVAEGIPLYHLIAELMDADVVSLPTPQFNMFSGGMHANNKLSIQEFLLVPLGEDFREAFEKSTMIFHTLTRMLQEYGCDICVGDEGTFIIPFDTYAQALDLLVEAIEKVASTQEFGIALDVAASHFYDTKTQLYNFEGDYLDAGQLIDLYKELVVNYPIVSIEDGLAEDDWHGWQQLTAQLGSAVQLVGDDLFVTSLDRIERGVYNNVANAVIIKPNQVGTVTQTLQAIQFGDENNYSIVISHRSRETEDTFIADLAIGSSAHQIKAGGLCRSERIAKYNQLLRVYDWLIGLAGGL